MPNLTSEDRIMTVRPFDSLAPLRAWSRGAHPAPPRPLATLQRGGPSPSAEWRCVIFSECSLTFPTGWPRDEHLDRRPSRRGPCSPAARTTPSTSPDDEWEAVCQDWDLASETSIKLPDVPGHRKHSRAPEGEDEWVALNEVQNEEKFVGE